MSKRLGKFAAAAVVYAVFAVYLYQPHFKHFDSLRYLVVLNACLSSLGCFVLSKRWVASFGGSFFAGAVYGFGPFALWLSGYHPTAGVLAASIPWLFCPAAYLGRYKCPPLARPRLSAGWISIPFSALPFLVTILFFQAASRQGLFAIPLQTKLHLADLVGLLVLLVIANTSSPLTGFYHVPIAALVMGILMLFAARRFGPMCVFAIGTVLAFCDSFFNVSPIIWLTMPVLCCSVLVGVGMQGLVSAGFADRKWVLAVSILMLVLAVAALLLATKYFQVFAGLADKYAARLTETAKMYILGAVATAILFFMARAKLRMHWLRWLILCSAMTVDIFLGARFIVDRIF